MTGTTIGDQLGDFMAQAVAKLPAIIPAPSAEVIKEAIKQEGLAEPQVLPNLTAPGHNNPPAHAPTIKLYEDMGTIVAEIAKYRDEVTKAGDKLEGTELSRLAKVAGSYAHLRGLQAVDAVTGNVVPGLPHDPDERWKAIRTFIVAALDGTEEGIQWPKGGRPSERPTTKVTIPTAVKAGMLVADGLLYIASFAKGDAFGDEAKPNGTPFPAAPWNTVQPKIVSTEKRGKHTMKEVRDNASTYLTKLTAQHVALLFDMRYNGVVPTIGKDDGLYRRPKVEKGATTQNATPAPTKITFDTKNVAEMLDALPGICDTSDIAKSADNMHNLMSATFQAMKKHDWSKADDTLRGMLDVLLTECMEVDERHPLKGSVEPGSLAASG